MLIREVTMIAHSIKTVLGIGSLHKKAFFLFVTIK